MPPTRWEEAGQGGEGGIGVPHRRHVQFEISIRHLSGDVEKTDRRTSLEFRERFEVEIRTGKLSVLFLVLIQFTLNRAHRVPGTVLGAGDADKVYRRHTPDHSVNSV